MARRAVTDFMEFAWTKIEISETDCWEWQGALTNGYGHLYLKNFGNNYAHRLVYEHLIGPIPDGLQLDHLCRNTCCCNPEHLEPVTQKENLRRGTLSRKGRNYSVFFDKANGVWIAQCALLNSRDGRRRYKRVSSRDVGLAVAKMERFLEGAEHPNRHSMPAPAG